MLVTMSLELRVGGQGQSSCDERDDSQAVREERVLHNWPACEISSAKLGKIAGQRVLRLVEARVTYALKECGIC